MTSENINKKKSTNSKHQGPYKAIHQKYLDLSKKDLVPVRFAILYIQLLLWLCTMSPTVLMFISWLLCHMLWLVTCDSVCDVTILWPLSHFCDSVTIMWYFPHSILVIIYKKRKEKEKKYKYWLSYFAKSWHFPALEGPTSTDKLSWDRIWGLLTQYSFSSYTE